jgi:type I site-specific restriction endonuclease
MEYSLRSDRFRIIPGKNLAVQEKKNSREKLDYILFRGVNRPIAVVEAKKSARSG